MEKNIAAIYTRVSTEEQANQFSLDAQKKQLVSMAQSKHLHIIDIYNEGGISGESLSTRPEILRLLNDAENGNFQYLLITSLDRLSRNLSDSIYLRQKLKDCNVTILTPSQEFSHDSIDHDLTANIWGTIADYERKRILERCQAGRIEKRSKGGWLGGHPPSGYRFDPVNKRLVIDPDKIDIIKYVYELSLQCSPYNTANILNKEGYNFTPRQIRRMIDKHKILFYSGRVIDYSGNIVVGEWPAIISKEMADSLLNAKRNRRMNSSTRAKYLLTGMDIFKCRFCGYTVKSFTGSSRKNAPRPVYYRCSSIQYAKACSNNKMHRIKRIDSLIWDLTVSIIEKFKDTNLILREWVYSSRDDQKINRLNKELDNIKKRRDRLILAIESDTISMGDAGERMAELRKQELNIIRVIDRLTQSSDTANYDMLIEAIESIDLNNDLTFTDRRFFIKTIFHKIEFGKKALYCNFTSPLLIGSAKTPSSEFKIRI